MNSCPNLSVRESAAFVPPILLAVALAFATGCQRNDIQVYRVAKELTKPANDSPEHNHEADHAGPASLQWKVPAGWQEQPAGNMRVGSFVISGQNGEKGEVAVLPMPSMAGRESE